MRGPRRSRASGILLHPTSLPGGAIGDLGSRAYEFVDWLVSAGQSYWQILPLVAVDEGGSPYNGLSAFAGNPLLVSPEAVAEDGLLDPGSVTAPPDLEGAEVDFPGVVRWKEDQLATAFLGMFGGTPGTIREELEEYRERNASWLDDYTLFRALRHAHDGAPWTDWAEQLRAREPEAMRDARRTLAQEIELRAFQQFLFDRQWTALRDYANGRGISIIGDIPIFVSHDSSDVWANQEIFFLDEEGCAEVVSGVPPDYFSQTGQRWGNPLYRWDVLRERGYDWWVERFRRTLSWVDIVRIDHFRGFESYWEIPANEETAIHGQWRSGPGAEFFRVLERELGALPVIAEDLGMITSAVEELRDELHLPGMRVLQFGFDGDPTNPHRPENYPAHSVVYTGTHDNDTIAGWWSKASEEERTSVREVIPSTDHDLHWEMASLVLESAAELAILPIQDVLGLDAAARMNTPGTSSGNWTWRLPEGQPSMDDSARLHELSRRSDRLPRSPVGTHASAVSREIG